MTDDFIMKWVTCPMRIHVNHSLEEFIKKNDVIDVLDLGPYQNGNLRKYRIIWRMNGHYEVEYAVYPLMQYTWPQLQALGLVNIMSSKMQEPVVITRLLAPHSGGYKDLRHKNPSWYEEANTGIKHG